MGEGWEQMCSEVAPSSSSRAEDEDEVGESSSLSGGDSSDDEQVKDHDAANSSSDSQAPLHESSSPASLLPIKRGLSKFYQGKSQSLSTFSDLRSVEDLAKKETPINRKMKPSRSYAGGMDDEAQNNSYYGPLSGPYNNSTTVPKRGPRGPVLPPLQEPQAGAAISLAASLV